MSASENFPDNFDQPANHETGPTQELLEQLRTLIVQKAENGVWRADSWGFGGDGIEQSLGFDTEEKGLIHLNDYRDDGSLYGFAGQRDQEVKTIAKVTLTEWLDKPFQLGLYREYTLSRIPDGLNVSKTQGISGPSGSLLGLNREEIEDIVEDGHIKYDKRRDAAQHENELGLNAVTQVELEEVVASINSSSPIDIVPRIKK